MGDIKSKFTLHKEYQDFVPGQTSITFETLSPHVTSLPGCLVNFLVAFFMLSCGFCMALAVFVFYVPSNTSMSPVMEQSGAWSSGNMFLAMIMILILALMFVLLGYGSLQQIYPYLYARRNQSKLMTNGILLEGEIMSVSGYTPYKGLLDYYVGIRYSFETPRKKVLKGFAEALRQDLKDKDLPSVGTPVTVLYADDGGHMML